MEMKLFPKLTMYNATGFDTKHNNVTLIHERSGAS